MEAALPDRAAGAARRNGAGSPPAMDPVLLAAFRQLDAGRTN
eukprot:COSAG04_NODE_5542_length_1576_cov_1.775897_1_plen_41_part_10